MSTITDAQPDSETRSTPTPTVRKGLVLSAIIGLANLPFLAPDIDWGGDDVTPPYPLLIIAAVIGMVSVVCAVLAWNDARRRYLRINAAALIINALNVVPGLFIDTTDFIRVVTALIIVATIAAVVMTLRREPRPALD